MALFDAKALCLQGPPLVMSVQPSCARGELHAARDVHATPSRRSGRVACDMQQQRRCETP
eukprot:1673723-Pleurochrysis_carterae.AAC.1